MKLLCDCTEEWLYKLQSDYTWNCGRTYSKDIEFKDKVKSKVRLRISKNGDITVLSNYSWDGCSPKFCFLDIQFGIPDGGVYCDTGKPKAYYASLMHDALYQFLDDGLPFSRLEVDKIFLILLEETRFRPRHIYFYTVVLLGGIFRNYGKSVGKKKPRNLT